MGQPTRCASMKRGDHHCVGLVLAMPFRRRKTVGTAGRSYGGPSEKFVGGLGGIFKSCPVTSQKLPLCGNHQTQCILGPLLRSLLQNPRNFSEVAPEVRPAVHTAALRLSLRDDTTCIFSGTCKGVVDHVQLALKIVVSEAGTPEFEMESRPCFHMSLAALDTLFCWQLGKITGSCQQPVDPVVPDPARPR